MVNTFEALAFVINYQKNHLVPSQDLVFLGAWFMTVANLVCLPLEQAQVIASLVSRFKVG